MPPRPSIADQPVGWIAWLALGAGLLALAWVLPVNVKSLNPALLREAGRDTQTVASFGQNLLELDKPGPAELVLEAAGQVGDPGASGLQAAFDDFAERHPDMMPWGGWDPALDPLLQAKPSDATGSTPVLRFLAVQRAREALRTYLGVSRLPAVQTILKTADLTATVRFVPARQPGGQPLDAVILLTGYLWQSERLSPSLQREVKTLAEAAVASRQMGRLEDFYLDILTLGKRLDWTQLAELLRTATGTATVEQFAHLARLAPDHLPVIYTAALMNRSADDVARYLIGFGQPGVDNLRLALKHGTGAVRQLVERQSPITPAAGPEFEFGAGFALRHPDAALLVKYAAFLAGIFLLLRSLDLKLFRAIERALHSSFPRMGSGLIALILTFIFFVFSEPYLLKAAPLSEFQLRLVLPTLGAATPPAADATSNASTSMEQSTVISIIVFALLQIGMYVICLLKISEIDRQGIAPQLKLRLMENEENLFDGGLYIGIAGTATALVLQVLGLIEANLLAAYSSNLFGIVCVALVKIRHVRTYKRRLIVEAGTVAA